MDNIDFLSPLSIEFLNLDFEEKSSKLGQKVKKYVSGSSFPDLSEIDIVILGVEEGRNSVNNYGCRNGSYAFRKYFYQLYSPHYNIKIADIGNILQGNTPEDTYFALQKIVKELFDLKIVPIIIGGSQDLSYPIYKAYEEKKEIINIVSIDNKFDLGDSEQELFAGNYLSHILLNKPNYLFNFSNIGYQTYFVEQDAISLMNSLYFDIFRLGYFKNSIYKAEPILRNADFITVDLSSVRQSDSNGNFNSSPNGFYGEEFCQLSLYAGSSNNVSCIGFFELNPELDVNGQSAHLMAQAVWYFIDGFYQRVIEFPTINEENFIRHEVQSSEEKENIIFYKSTKTNRWWVEIKDVANVNANYLRHYIIPCSESDYKSVLSNNIPDRLWQAYQKLM